MIPVTRSHSGGNSGFTLLEMLLALAVSGFVGLGVVMMLDGIGYATSEAQDTRSRVVDRQIVIHRVSGLLRTATRVLDTDDHTLVLWRGDSNGNGTPQLSELRVLQWDQNAAELRLHETPDGVTPNPDPTFELTSDFIAVTQGYLGTDDLPANVIAREIDQWRLRLDAANLEGATMLQAEFALGAEVTPTLTTVVTRLGGKY